MKKLNWKVRIKNPLFWVQICGAVLLTALTYNSLQPNDLTTWAGAVALGKGVITNPYLLVSCLWSAWGAANDPTTAGAGDSEQALAYDSPKKGDGKHE